MNKDVWHDPLKEKPPKSGRYLVYTPSGYYDLFDYSTDLSKVDRFNKRLKKGVEGWYYLDSEWGYIFPKNIVAWAELPKPPNVEDLADENRVVER